MTWADIAEMVANRTPDGDAVIEGDGCISWVSAEGIQHSIDMQNLVDRYREGLEVIEQVYPFCEHGYPIEDFSGWSVNDYVLEWVTEFLRDTWHGDQFCIGLRPVAIGSMLLVLQS